MTAEWKEPSDELTEEEINEYREVSLKYFRILNITISYLVESTSPMVSEWAVCYGMGLAVCEGVSITDRAEMLKVSPQALSKQVKKFCKDAGLPASPYMYNKS